jgi:hypothetical protein
MNPIVLEARTSIAPENRGVRSKPGGSWFNRKIEWAAEGLTVTPKSFDTKEGEHHEFDEVDLTAEFAPVRGFSFADLRKGIVATIGSQNFMIRIEVETEDDGDSAIPKGATVCFIPTTLPETPFTPFNEEAAKVEFIANLRLDNEKMLADEDAEWNKEFIERNNQQIEDIESGKRKLRPPGEVLLFGKPQWIQNPIFPAFAGKAARCLAVLETGWGDCGNINLLFTQDANGLPNNVWFEASCC